jgi:catechol 2,3-dioxygenase-like lactoylglutathione lyase family enzyme
MANRVRPMIHVPDVAATVAWYQSLGFEVVSTNEDEGRMDWALLSFGEGQVMFSAGGTVSSATRREVDLYVNAENVAALYERLKDRVHVHEGIHDTFYGMREFIVRDLNGFWVTFGESIG